MVRPSKGFTLVEMMIAVAIMAILATIALPLFTDQIRASRRFDATSTLMSIEQEQELYRTNNTSYGTLAQVWNGATATPDNHYNLSITNVTATGYTVTATATGDQARDDEAGVVCNPLQVVVTNLQTTRTPAVCW